MFKIFFHSTVTEEVQLSRLRILQDPHLQLGAAHHLVRRIIIVGLDSWLRAWFMNSQEAACILLSVTIHMEITSCRRPSIIQKHNRFSFIMATTVVLLMVSRRIILMNHQTLFQMRLFLRAISSSFKTMEVELTTIPTRVASIIIILRPILLPSKMRAIWTLRYMSNLYRDLTTSLNSLGITVYRPF